MGLRQILSFVFALAFFALLSAFSAGSALAHAAHGQHSSASKQIKASNVAKSKSAETWGAYVAEFGEDRFRESVNRSNGVDDVSTDPDAPAPCYGKCCGIASHFCCGLTPPTLIVSAICARLSALKLLLANDAEHDGLSPGSILRPPRAFA